MATKLTKTFAEFVGERGFEIANEEEISKQPGEEYKLSNLRDFLLPLLMNGQVKVG